MVFVCLTALFVIYWYVAVVYSCGENTWAAGSWLERINIEIRAQINLWQQYELILFLRTSILKSLLLVCEACSCWLQRLVKEEALPTSFHIGVLELVLKWKLLLLKVMASCAVVWMYMLDFYSLVVLQFCLFFSRWLSVKFWFSCQLTST